MVKGLLGSYIAVLRAKEQDLFSDLAARIEPRPESRQFEEFQPEWQHLFIRITEALADHLEESMDGRPLVPGDLAGSVFGSIASELGVEAAACFRKKNLPFPVFLTLVKQFPHPFTDTLYEVVPDSTALKLISPLLRDFFDRLEVAASREWLKEDNNFFQRKLREAKHFILHEKRRYATIFYKMAEPAFVVDERLRLVDVNRAFEEFFKVNGDSLLGKHCRKVLGQEVCDACLLEKALIEHSSFSNIEVKVPVGGEEKIVLMNGTSLGYVSGDFPGGIVILQDVTERRRVAQALRDSEEKYRSLIENVPDVTWRADAAGGYLFLSPNITKITGFGPEVLLAEDKFFHIHPDDVQEVRQCYHDLFAKQQKFDIRYRHGHKDGGWLWFHDRANVIRKSGKTVYADGVCSDVTRMQEMEEELWEYRSWLEDLVDERTDELRVVNEKLLLEVSERKDAQHELELLAERLKRSNAELEQFAHVASHDMKEPLMLVVAFSERLLQKCHSVLDEKGREYVERILKSARQLQDLVDDILELSRVRTSERPFEQVELDDLVHGVLADLEERISQVRGEVTIESLCPVKGDTIQLRQLFLNLFTNALKYRKKDIAPSILLTAVSLADGTCEIRLKDNGIGFEEKHLDKIFHPFVRLHSRSDYEGTGIGLATCEKIVQRHGGTISATSVPDKGTTFIIRLPKRAGKPRQVEKEK